PEVLQAMPALAQGNDRQDRPETIPVLHFELTAGLPMKEALEDRLHHVFRVFLVLNRAAQSAAGQGDEPLPEPLEDLLSRVGIALAQAGHQVIEGSIGRHEQRSSGTRKITRTMSHTG